MTDARHRETWSNKIEFHLGLKQGSYCRKNATHHAAELRNFNNIEM